VSQLKLALSCNEITILSSGMSFDTIIFLSAKPRSLMKIAGFLSNRLRLKVSQCPATVGTMGLQTFFLFKKIKEQHHPRQPLNKKVRVDLLFA